MAIKDRFITLVNAVLPQAMKIQFREASDTAIDPDGQHQFREASGTTIDPDEEQWRKLSDDTKRDLAPLTQSRMQKIAHFLWESNLLANRLIEVPVAYLLAEGVKLQVKNEDNQKVIDRFWNDPINEMALKLPKKVRELALFGEQVYPVFVNEYNGAVRLGYLDPALIETVVMDPDNKEQPIGIVTVKDRKGRALRYRVIINGPEDAFTQRTQEIRKTFDTGDAFYFRVNDLSSGTRGRSDLLAQSDWLDAYDQFLFGELDRSNFLRAFLWDVTLKGATETDVKTRAREITSPRPGSVRVHNDSETWDAVTPDLKAQDTAAGAQLFRNHVLGGATMPEHWFGGGGDVNRAVGAEMTEPTFKVMTMRQNTWKYILESIGRYVLWRSTNKEEQPDFSDSEWKVEAIFPELAARDVEKFAQALQQVVAACGIAVQNKFITRVTAVRLINAIAKLLGIEIDAEQELAAAIEEARTDAENDVFPPPAADPGAASGAGG